MSLKKVAENSEKFFCEKCDYSCSKKSDFNKHLLTRKHKNGDFFTFIEQKSRQKIPEKNEVLESFGCKYCNKTYKIRNSLWYHEKRCGDKKVANNIDTLTNLVLEVVQNNNELQKHNSELQKQNKEFQTKMIDTFSNVIVNQNNCVVNNINSNNKTSFNLHFFLNEKCKNASNLSDFMNSIELSIDDLENVGKLGYVDGISNIIINKLKEMDVYSRPIHCADSKREIIYIKENDVWTKEDTENQRLRKSIKEVSFKNCRNFHLFKEKHPDCVKSDSVHSDHYLKIVSESIGGKGGQDITNNENKIIKKIAREMYIDKSKFAMLGF
uniref:C2H2-type domain-containing protein n=1 Tax=viral metagenome TaxID=1070528 RepID=A0A6C0E4J2_9ZZZZ